MKLIAFIKKGVNALKKVDVVLFFLTLVVDTATMWDERITEKYGDKVK